MNVGEVVGFEFQWGQGGGAITIFDFVKCFLSFPSRVFMYYVTCKLFVAILPFTSGRRNNLTPQ